MWAALLFLVLALVSSEQASAEVWTPPEPTPAELSEIAGWSVRDIPISNGENYSRIKVQIQEENLKTKQTSTWSTCESLDLDPCRNSENKVKDALILLPHCLNKSDEWCIDSLAIQKIDSKEKPAKYIRQVKGLQTPAYPELGLPAGSTVSLWRSADVVHAGGTDTYAAYVMVRFINWPDRGLSIAYTRATVLPYREVIEQNNSEQQRYFETQFVNEIKEDGTSTPRVIGGSNECAWTENKICGVVEEFSENSEVSLAIRLGKKVTGWFSGRLKNQQISVSSLSSTQNLLTIKAAPVDVPQFYGAVSREKLTKALASTWLNDGWGTKNPQGIYSVRSDSPGVIQIINNWKEVVNDKAAGLISSWSFSATRAGLGSKCLTSNDVVVGFVSTNAMAYEGTAPNFVNGSLDYKVGGLHLNPDGSVFEGTYDLTMRKSVARCLYGLTEAPISGTVSVLNDGNEEKISTTSIRETGSEKNGWISIAAQGFTFSNPILRVKLKQPSITITCIKGKNIKKLTGISPKCPNGFKRK